MAAVAPNTYRRHDGVIGVGFLIEYAGRSQHSVAWPDAPAERYTPDEMLRRNVKIRDAAPSDAGSGSLLKQELELLKEENATLANANHDLSTELLEIKSRHHYPTTPAADESSPASEYENDEDREFSEEFSEDDDEPTPTPTMTEAEAIRAYLTENTDAENAEVIKALAEDGIEVSSSQVSRQRKRLQAQENAE